MAYKETRHQYYLKNKAWLNIINLQYYYDNRTKILNNKKVKRDKKNNKIENNIYLTEYPIIEIIDKKTTLYFS